MQSIFGASAARRYLHMILVGKKEDKDNIIGRQYNSLKMYWCEINYVVDY